MELFRPEHVFQLHVVYEHEFKVGLLVQKIFKLSLDWLGLEKNDYLYAFVWILCSIADLPLDFTESWLDHIDQQYLGI